MDKKNNSKLEINKILNVIEDEKNEYKKSFKKMAKDKEIKSLTDSGLEDFNLIIKNYENE